MPIAHAFNLIKLGSFTGKLKNGTGVNMKILVIGFIVVLVIMVFWCISTRNRIKMMEVKVDEAKSGIDIALIKRYDILTESLNVAKGYAAHEKQLMLQLIEARSGMSIQQTQEVIKNQERVLENLKITLLLNICNSIIPSSSLNKRINSFKFLVGIIILTDSDKL